MNFFKCYCDFRSTGLQARLRKDDYIIDTLVL